MQPSPRADRTRRILIIDDERDFGEALQLIFETSYETEAVISGQEALHLFKNGSDFDVILCDLSLTDMTGKEIYEAAKLLRPGLEERFIFLTGGAYTDQGKRFLETIPSLVLEKPINMSTLRKTIHERMNQTR